MSQYLHVRPAINEAVIDATLFGEREPETERRPELTDAWAKVMTGYIERSAAEPLRTGNNVQRIESTE